MEGKYKFHINGRGSEWNFVNIIRDILRDDPEWEEVSDPKSIETLHYSDRDEFDPVIRNYISATVDFVDKYYMAKKVSKHVPLTLTVRNNRIESQKKKLSSRDKRSKWFLKPSGGYGGTGINVFLGLGNFRRFLKNSRARFVLQKEVTDPMLFDNQYKFDIRNFVAMVYYKNRYHLYLFPDGICRVSLTKYNALSSNADADLTNCSIQEKHEEYSSEKINKITNMLSWYESVIPKIKHAVICTIGKLKGALKRPKNRNIIEIIAFDIIVNKKKDVYVLEINRNIGYGYDRKPAYVVDIYKRMFKDLVKFVYEPIINKTKFNKPEYWLKCGVV